MASLYSSRGFSRLPEGPGAEFEIKSLSPHKSGGCGTPRLRGWKSQPDEKILHDIRRERSGLAGVGVADTGCEGCESANDKVEGVCYGKHCWQRLRGRGLDLMYDNGTIEEVVGGHG